MSKEKCIAIIGVCGMAVISGFISAYIVAGVTSLCIALYKPEDKDVQDK